MDAAIARSSEQQLLNLPNAQAASHARQEGGFGFRRARRSARVLPRHPEPIDPPRKGATNERDET
jgi:hypothetical protein